MTTIVVLVVVARQFQLGLLLVVGDVDGLDGHSDNLVVPIDVEYVERQTGKDTYKLVQEDDVGPDRRVHEHVERVPDGHYWQDTHQAERDEHRYAIVKVQFALAHFELEQHPTEVDERRGAFTQKTRQCYKRKDACCC